MGMAVQSGQCLEEVRRAYEERHLVEPKPLVLGEVLFEQLESYRGHLAMLARATAEPQETDAVHALVVHPRMREMLEGTPPMHLVEKAASICGWRASQSAAGRHGGFQLVQTSAGGRSRRPGGALPQQPAQCRRRPEPDCSASRRPLEARRT